MGLIQNLIKGSGEDKREFKEKFKEAQQKLKVQGMLEEREKSSNQRELERYLKQQREKRIKMELDKIHKKQKKEMWEGQNILKSQTSILKEGKSILTNDRPILGQKNIFLDNKSNNPITKKRLFFKW
ncbi:MAG TPA: hypothetical protein ENG87_01740 [Candidatus Pacearchaeota archaeon]|nr:hypothetical protein [Candidatus Pacearchaeota archaeon]